jgi:membrane protease YdiL (CAAX protease family)
LIVIKIKTEIKNLVVATKNLDRKVIIVFLSVAVLQTISFYFTSRRFFRANLFETFQNSSDPYLIEYLYWFLGDFFTFFILGILIIKFGFKEKLKDFGLQFGDVKTGLTFSFLFLFIMIILVWIVSATPEFAEKYPHLTSAKSNWNTLLIYETGMLVYMIAWEFIWRGFMLFGLEKKFGYYAVLMQMIPFVILHNGKPFLETFGAIFGGIALGVLALRTRSIYYCIIIHIGVMYSIDIISSLRFRANDYGIGIESLINIIKQIL